MTATPSTHIQFFPTSLAFTLCSNLNNIVAFLGIQYRSQHVQLIGIDMMLRGLSFQSAPMMLSRGGPIWDLRLPTCCQAPQP